MTTTLPPLPIIDGHFFIDNSALEKYTTCRRSYEYYAIRQRTLREERAALAFGGLIHRALETRYRWQAATGLTPLHTSFDPVERQQFDLIENWFRANPSAEGDHRTAAFAQEIVLLYNRYYIEEPYEVVKDAAGDPLVEVPFVQPLGVIDGIQIMWTGRIDLVARWDKKTLLHMDHKTTSMGGDRFFEEFVNDQAQIGYAWALQKTIGVRIDGFVINAIVCRRPTATGKGIEFLRRKFYLEPDRIDEWEHNCLSLVEDVFRDHKRKYFPLETKWCVGKYGRCQYLDVCSVARSGRNALLYSNLFQDVDWSPLNKPGI